jgi:hypothetical protein
MFANYLGPTSCVVSEANLGSAPGMSDNYWMLDDFGEVICFYRYWWLRDEYKFVAASPRPEEIERKQQAEHYFDALLERFVREGYQPEMEQLLQDGVQEYLEYRYLYGVYVLPQDLPQLLYAFGNPLVDDEEEDQEGSSQPEFDLEISEHLEAMERRIMAMLE